MNPRRSPFPGSCALTFLLLPVARSGGRVKAPDDEVGRTGGKAPIYKKRRALFCITEIASDRSSFLDCFLDAFLDFSTTSIVKKHMAKPQGTARHSF